MTTTTASINDLESAVFDAAPRGPAAFQAAVNTLAARIVDVLGSLDRTYEVVERDLLVAVDLAPPALRDDYLEALRLSGLPLSVEDHEVDDTFIEHIIERGDIDWIESLARAGYPFDATQLDDLSLIHLTVKYRKPQLIACLVNHGAPVNGIPRSELASPLHGAVELDDPECIRALIDAGADPYVYDNEERTPAYCAIIENREQAFLALLACGVDVTRLHPESRSLKDVAEALPFGVKFAQLVREHTAANAGGGVTTRTRKKAGPGL